MWCLFYLRGDWDAAEHQQSSAIFPTGIPWRYIEYTLHVPVHAITFGHRTISDYTLHVQYMYFYIQLLTQCIPSYIATVYDCMYIVLRPHTGTVPLG